MELIESLETAVSNDKDDIMVQLQKKNNAERVLLLNDEIDPFVIDNYEMFILNWNREDKDIPKDKRKPIKLYINSVGGDMFSAMSLIDIISSSVTPIIGVGFGLVASAAFHIYIACHKRIAFPNTVFLMHDGEMSISNSTSKAKDTIKFLNHMDERVKQHVLQYTKITEDFYDSHFEQEVYMYPDEAREKGIIDLTVGTDANVNDIV